MTTDRYIYGAYRMSTCVDEYVSELHGTLGCFCLWIPNTCNYCTSEVILHVGSMDFSWYCLCMSLPCLPQLTLYHLILLQFYILQYQRFGENLTATVLRSLEITNFVDMVSPQPCTQTHWNMHVYYCKLCGDDMHTCLYIVYSLMFFFILCACAGVK